MGNIRANNGITGDNSDGDEGDSLFHRISVSPIIQQRVLFVLEKIDPTRPPARGFASRDRSFGEHIPSG